MPKTSRAIDEPSAPRTDSRKRAEKVLVKQHSGAPVCRNGNSWDPCGRHSTICGRSKSFPHMRDIPPCIQHPRVRTGNTGIINTQRAGAYQPECTGSLFRGRQYNSLPSVAANSVAADSHRQPVPWPPIQLRALRRCQLRGCRFSIPPVAAPADSQSLPYPSRKPPTRGRQYMHVESTIQKAHQPWDSTREVCAFLALPSVQHARARLPKARPFMRLPALDSQKAPGTFILPEPLEPLPSRPAQPSPPPTPSVITLLPASRARRARSHTFRFSS
jgi:hypothetical protein